MIKCTHCRSRNVRKAGFYIVKGAKFQRYLCKNCGRVFTAGAPLPLS